MLIDNGKRLIESVANTSVYIYEFELTKIESMCG